MKTPILTQTLAAVKQTQELSLGLLRTVLQLALVLVVVQLLVWQLRQDQPLVALSQMLRVAKEALVVSHTPLVAMPMPKVETAEALVTQEIQNLQLEMLPPVQVIAKRLLTTGETQLEASPSE
jgi:hypothetical protein